MKTERTPTVTDLPVTLADAKAAARIDHTDDDALLTRYVRAAAADIEAQAGLALLTTTVNVTLDAGEVCSPIFLGIGPVAEDATATVYTVGEDGSTAELDAGAWWFEAGRWPRLHVVDSLSDGLIINYSAGMGEDADEIPDDLVTAICDQTRWLYDGMPDRGPALAPSAARVVARHRGARL
ncbi:MAG: head-tail connector protein [Pseudooceanicola sp.]|nr:head-tail connector protein [Pseudooceanicola sp.]